MKKQIIFSHGTKGGVGKSVVSAVTSERVLSTGAPITIVEGDPSIRDVLTRYVGVPGVTSAFLSLNVSGDANNAVGDLAAYLEQNMPDTMVVNLPAGASETVDGLGDLIRGVADALDYDLKVVYSLDTVKAAALDLKKSFESGLMSVVEPHFRAVNYPQFKGVPAKFEWTSMDERKQNPAHEIIVPALPNQAAFKSLDRTPGRIATLAETGAPGWMVVDRLNVARWLPKAMAALDPIFAVNE
ncbi:MAG: P-loop NTPase family protein [Acidiferrobacterales bacterium]